MARIYADIFSLQNTSIVQVGVDPNGVLAGDVGSLALQNTSPPKLWQNTGGTSWTEIPTSSGGTSSLVGVPEKELVPLGGNSISDFIRINADGSLSEVRLYCSEAYVTAGSITLDVLKNGASVLSSVFDLETLSALPNSSTLSLNSPPIALASGDVLEIQTISDNVDLTGAGLTAFFSFDV